MPSRHLSPVAPFLVLLFVLGASSPLFARPGPATSPADEPPLLSSGQTWITTSARGGSVGTAKAAGDSVAIFGGPGTLEGRFQDATGAPDLQGWTTVDRTMSDSHWQISTFNASTLDPGVSGNHAFWCGEESAPGWAAAPGYGNSWNTTLGFEWPVADPSQPHEVRLQFVFHHDTEPGYDFFLVEWDSAGTRMLLERYDNYNADDWGDPPTTPVSFDRSVSYAGNDYAGEAGDQIRLLLRVTSDGAWSNEDGLWPSPFGAVQADNLHVQIDGQTISLADAEGGPDDAHWQEESSPFAGDFAKILPRAVDLDPCVENRTPVVSFIDDGTPPNNASERSTGGTWSPTWSPAYGGSAVVNHTTGLSDGAFGVLNDVVSPEIAWDLPGTTADDGLDSGAFLRFDVYEHLPLDNNIFWQWAVRSRPLGGEWSGWQDRGFIYYGLQNRNWKSKQIEIRDLLVDEPEAVQVRLSVTDQQGKLPLPGGDATPSPMFDNVEVRRYQHPGPLIQIQPRSLFQDAFPNRDVSPGDAASVDHAVRLDVNATLGSQSIIPGDSMVVQVDPVVPGTSLDGPPVLRWVLEANPRYDGVRALPTGSGVMGTTSRGWNLWQGDEAGQPVIDQWGNLVPDQFALDLPDGAARPQMAGEADEAGFFFPGDVLRFAVIANDDGGGQSQLPRSLGGLLSGTDHDPMFTVRALPSVDAGTSETPDLLIYYDASYQTNRDLYRLDDDRHIQIWQRGEFWELRQVLRELGLLAGVDYDLFVGRGDEHVYVNDLGHHLGHGATLDQIGGYATILYLTEESRNFPGDGTKIHGSSGSMLFGSTVDLLDGWRALPGDRSLIYLGDRLVERGVEATAVTADYVLNSMGVDWSTLPISEFTGGQSVPFVAATGSGQAAGFSPNLSFTVDGSCPVPRVFNGIVELGGAITTHRFLSTGGSEIGDVAAGVLFERSVNGDVKRDLTFSFGLSSVTDSSQPRTDPFAARTALLREALGVAGVVTSTVPVTVPDRRVGLVVEAARPNPFNPRTEIAWRAPSAGELKIEVFDLRGRRILTLIDGPVDAGLGRVRWEGTDERGASVASGVYLVAVEGFGRRIHRKVALVE